MACPTCLVQWIFACCDLFSEFNVHQLYTICHQRKPQRNNSTEIQKIMKLSRLHYLWTRTAVMMDRSPETKENENKTTDLNFWETFFGQSMIDNQRRLLNHKSKKSNLIKLDSFRRILFTVPLVIRLPNSCFGQISIN